MLNKIVFFLSVLISFSVAAEDMDIYTANVEVDATAANAAKAREKAMTEANRKALYAVTNRISTASSTQILEALNDNQILNFIQEVSVISEKVADSRYLASLKVTINAPILKTYLAEKDAPVTILPESHFIIIPVYRESEVSAPQLWEDSNIWYNVWNDNQMESGQITMRPISKTDKNQKLITAEDALQFNGLSLDALRQQNNAEIYIAETVIISGSINATLKSPNSGIMFTKTYPNTGTSSFENAVQDMKTAILSQIQQHSVEEAEKLNTITVVYNFDKLKDWVSLRQKLKNIRLIQNMTTDTMSGHSTQLTLEYTGATDELFKEFSAQNLTLTDSGNYYLLEGM